jgi:glycosyltransferase involved in cell wall biosynthesis
MVMDDPLMLKKTEGILTANQWPQNANYVSRFIRSCVSLLPVAGIYWDAPRRPLGISVYMRVKDERDWIAASVASVKGIADEIVIVDNGSSDGTYEILQELADAEKGLIKLFRKPELNYLDLSNFVLSKTSFRWILKWDGDFIARTTGIHDIAGLRKRILSLDSRRYYLIYLRHVNLAGDLFHQDPQEMVHIEEYVHTFSEAARFIHPGRYEAVKFPLYYKPLFWYEPYVFHVNVKPGRRMLLRYFWEEWMELKDYVRYPALEDYVVAHIEKEFGTASLEEAQSRCVAKILQNYIPYDEKRFGPYPAMLKPLMEKPAYRIEYRDGSIVGRSEPVS